MSKIKILLVSVGSLVGKNLLEIINHSREDFYLIGTNSISEFDSLAFLDEFHISPLSKSTEIEEFFYKDGDIPLSEGEPVGVDMDCGEEVKFILFKNIYWKPQDE